jgi:hypothetical protein
MELKGTERRLMVMRDFRIAALAGIVAVLGALLPWGLMSCTGTEVPDPEELYGTVRGPNGAPAARARVIAWAESDVMKKSQGDSSVRIKDTVTADDKGYYFFKNPLAEGRYNLYFEEHLNDTSNRALERKGTDYERFTRKSGIDANLSPPSILALRVMDYASESAIEGAECKIEDSPYQRMTGKDGLALFFVPTGVYTVTCSYAPPHLTRLWYSLPSLDLKSNSERQETIYLYPGGTKPDPLLPPDTLIVAYDENSGIANLSWPPVNDSRLYVYGVGRVNIDSGGGAWEFTTFHTTHPDAAFDPKDSVQQKNLLYSVYSLKRDPAGNGGSRRKSSALTARRPWAYGARIDSLMAVPRDSVYRAGDTVRFAAFWTNRMHANDTLYWWIQGGAEAKEIRVHPPAIGSDTLSVVLPTSGVYKVNLTIRDAEGYRSWLSFPFRL